MQARSVACVKTCTLQPTLCATSPLALRSPCCVTSRRRYTATHASSAATANSGSDSQQRNTLRVRAPNDDAPANPLEVDVQAPAGARVFTVSLKKPLGLVLTERCGRIEVESVAAGGHAAAAGVAAGDELLATTARAQGGQAIRGQLVLLPAGGQAFKTVAAAIKSNTCSQCLIHLVLARPAAA
ncbi:hypothetical protein HYH02_012832 [Chlamydomonas schloesseri]|uniref:PDZ domain-containing protein n=1 Tax=Chlamydomonas schloesseri TaxID=2026947 RepID=A0A835T7S3_9CHLO|nr:hypothetical protein HYH02_012832 [Chlamydomonas schloesseri]|eukprot:KAG2433131.1 hypothetical protein HYH02_012832 [Chlamydomonas schloesseri]